MSYRLTKVALASVMASMLLASPAAAGGYYAPGAFDGYCNCYPPAPRFDVIYAAQPIDYYVARKVYVPARVYVMKRAYVRTRMYMVDQGPSFYFPAAPYTLPRVYFPKKRPYPYGSNGPSYHRVHYGHRHRHVQRRHGPYVHWRHASQAGK